MNSNYFVVFLECATVYQWDPHFHPKLQGGFVEDYYYQNTNNYNIVLQVVVNCKIIDISMGFLGNVNESRVLRKFFFVQECMI